MIPHCPHKNTRIGVCIIIQNSTNLIQIIMSHVLVTLSQWKGEGAGRLVALTVVVNCSNFLANCGA